MAEALDSAYPLGDPGAIYCRGCQSPRYLKNGFMICRICDGPIHLLDVEPPS